MVKFETKLNSDSTKPFTRHSFARLWWLMLIFSLVFIGLGLLGYFKGEDSSDRIFGIMIMAIGVLFAPLVLVISLGLQRRLNKSASYIADGTDETYSWRTSIEHS